MPDFDIEDLSDAQLAAAAELLRARNSDQGGNSNSPFDATTRRPVDRENASANEKRQDLERRFNENTRGSAIRHSPLGNPDAPSVSELERYSRELLGTRATAALAKSAANPATRKAFQDMHPETW